MTYNVFGGTLSLTQLQLYRVAQIFSWFWQWNNFEYPLIFDEVKAYQKNCAIFWATLYIVALHSCHSTGDETNVVLKYVLSWGCLVDDVSFVSLVLTQHLSLIGQVMMRNDLL